MFNLRAIRDSVEKGLTFEDAKREQRKADYETEQTLKTQAQTTVTRQRPQRQSRKRCPGGCGG